MQEELRQDVAGRIALGVDNTHLELELAGGLGPDCRNLIHHIGMKHIV